MINWQENLSTLNELLLGLSVTDREGKEISQDCGFYQLKGLSDSARISGNSVFLIGNGASASMASHFATDLLKNAKLRTEVLTDLSLITAIANDVAYSEVYADPLRLKMDEGDMLAAISSSGNSPNIVRGAEEAKGSGGTIVTISAMAPDNRLRGLGHLNFYVPARTYGQAETSHAAILHYWTDLVIEGAD